MLKRSLYFGNPAYLSTTHGQLVVQFPDKEKEAQRVPIEDIGLVVLDHQRITMSSGLFVKLIQNKAAIVHCCDKHMPISLAQPLIGHTLQMKRFHQQLNMSKPLKKNLWKQVVVQKILNQAEMLDCIGEDQTSMLRFAHNVQSGDSTNQEAIAAAYYWQRLFEEELDFIRDRMGPFPNAYLNYGYAILRAMTARAIVLAGLIPSLGIHHKSKYNAYCLADDMMEPYRVYVDELVLELVNQGYDQNDLNKEIKQVLLQLPALDVRIDGQTKPLMNALQQTTVSLYKCITGELRSLILPSYAPSY